jgi:hypothetical protein
MSWKAEFKVGGEWCPNAVAFATRAESDAYGANKFMVWTVPSEWRSVESDQPVNYALDADGTLQPVKEGG